MDALGRHVLVAPDREHDMRSRPLRRLDLQLRDHDGHQIISVGGRPSNADEAEIEVEVHGARRTSPTRRCSRASWRASGCSSSVAGAWQRPYGFDGTP